MPKNQPPPFLCILLLVAALLITACDWTLNPSPTPAVGSCTLTLPASTSADQAIRAVLDAEGKLVVQQDITQLMQLWAEESYVADAKNTPQQTDDDQFWLEKDAIRHRYVRTVFPGAPQQATPADLRIEIMRDRAVVTATTQIGAEISPAGDRWTLVQRDGCWAIESLTYNLEANP
jgi:hypothetical protein